MRFQIAAERLTQQRACHRRFPVRVYRNRMGSCNGFGVTQWIRNRARVLSRLECASKWSESARVVAHGESDRQADTEPVLYELEGHVDERRISLRYSREWQHDEVHEEVD